MLSGIKGNVANRKGKVRDMRTLHLFAGAGGGLLADLILGHRPIAAVEWEPYACQALRERAADGWFPSLRVHECDVRLFDSSEYAGKVDCIHAGFPCQDISVAGKRAGVGEDTRSGLYREVLRIAEIVKPKYLFLENVAAITSNGLGTVIEDLASMSYVGQSICLSAAEVGAKHNRNRWWCLAKRVGAKRAGFNASEITGSTAQGGNGDSQRQRQARESSRPSEQYENVADTNISHGKRNECSKRGEPKNSKHEQYCWRQTEPGLGRVVDDVADRLDANSWNETEAQVGRVTDETKNRAERLKAIGNGQVPLQAAVAFSILWKMMEGI